MLNFAQLSATLNLRAVMEQHPRQRRRGAPGAAPELGLGPQLGLHRGPLADEERGPRRRRAAGRLRGDRARRDRARAARPPSVAAASSPSASSRTSASSAGTPSGATSSSTRPRARRWARSWSWSAATSRPTTTTRRRSRPCGATSRPRRRRSWTGSPARPWTAMRAANEVNLRMAPLTPDHHFYIDQGANAHVRLVLIAIGRKLVDAGRLDQPDDVMFLRYNELRALIGAAGRIDARGLVADRRAEREAARRIHPRDWVGTVTPIQLAFPYLVNWGYPERFYAAQSADDRPINGIGGVARRRRGHRARRPHGRRVRRGPRGRHPRLPDDQPGVGRPLHQDRRPRHRHRRHDLAPGRPVARVRHPGRHRHVRSRPSGSPPATGSAWTGPPASVEILGPRRRVAASGRGSRWPASSRAASWPTRSATTCSRAS